MDEMTVFEQRFEDRIRVFARTGVRPVNSAAVAHAVAVGHPRSVRGGLTVNWRGFTLDRRALTLALVLGLLLTLLGGGLLVGARLLLPPSPGEALVGLAYELDGDIYVADADGRDPIRIVDGRPTTDGSAPGPNAGCGAVHGSGGLVSPDGGHIAYRSEDDDCPSTVLISDPAGHLVVSVPGWGWDIAWSPDGARFATQGVDGGIGVYDIAGSLLAVLDGSHLCCGDYDPIWSPDGDSLLIPTGPTGERYPPNWELPLDGTAPSPVPAVDPRSVRGVAFSADGTQAAFMGQDPRVPVDGSGGTASVADMLIVSAADGSQRRVAFTAGVGETLEAFWGRGPVWSPVGDQVAFVVGRELTHDGNGYLTSSTRDLRLVDLGTGIVTPLASALGVLYINPLGFSPEGDKVLFAQTASDGVGSLWSANTDGSGARMLVAGTDVGGWLTLPAGADES